MRHPSHHVIFDVPLPAGHRLSLAEASVGTLWILKKDDERVPGYRWGAADVDKAVAAFQAMKARRRAGHPATPRDEPPRVQGRPGPAGN